MRRIPIFATLLVAVAVATMIALGVWQLRRMDEKAALIAAYATAKESAAEVAWPAPDESEARLYQRSRLLCVRVTSHTGIAGRSAKGEAGVAQVADCVLADGQPARVVLGWSRQPLATEGARWKGGAVRGVIAPGPRLVADPPLAGLEASARPDPSEIPNNHWSYAVQWFLFAVTALIIYAIALRRRLRGREGDLASGPPGG